MDAGVGLFVRQSQFEELLRLGEVFCALGLVGLLGQCPLECPPTQGDLDRAAEPRGVLPLVLGGDQLQKQRLIGRVSVQEVQQGLQGLAFQLLGLGGVRVPDGLGPDLQQAAVEQRLLEIDGDLQHAAGLDQLRPAGTEVGNRRAGLGELGLVHVGDDRLKHGLELEEYSHNFYVSLIEKSTGRGAVEIIIDRYSGSYQPEPQSMMWNGKYGMMSGYQQAQMSVTPQQAMDIAQDFLNVVYPGTEADEIVAYYGYYTIMTELEFGIPCHTSWLLSPLG